MATALPGSAEAESWIRPGILRRREQVLNALKERLFVARAKQRVHLILGGSKSSNFSSRVLLLDCRALSAGCSNVNCLS